MTTYYDHDPNILVTLTGDEEDYCVRMRVGETSILLHMRSAVDLSQKLQKAFLDFVLVASTELIRQNPAVDSELALTLQALVDKYQNRDTK